ncbi:MAG: hypothetical protein LBH59_06625 [Planctomycetaceae bacterium]|nr:hypothetical protein [Planctomycetaceae bacterium]
MQAQADNLNAQAHKITPDDQAATYIKNHATKSYRQLTTEQQPAPLAAKTYNQTHLVQLVITTKTHEQTHGIITQHHHTTVRHHQIVQLAAEPETYQQIVGITIHDQLVAPVGQDKK